MKAYQEKFLKIALSTEALEFGDFTLKSGRKSPYFFNAAKMLNGGSISELAGGYNEGLKQIKAEIYALVNTDLDQAATEVRTILQAERLRRDRQIGLTDFVKRLRTGY